MDLDELLEWATELESLLKEAEAKAKSGEKGSRNYS
jgi:hypothetical protein